MLFKGARRSQKNKPYPPPCFLKLSEGTELKKMKNLKASCINDRESKWFLLLVKFDFRRREILTSIAKTVVWPGGISQLRQLRRQGSKWQLIILLLYKNSYHLISNFGHFIDCLPPFLQRIRETTGGFFSPMCRTSAGGGTAPGVLPSWDPPQTSWQRSTQHIMTPCAGKRQPNHKKKKMGMRINNVLHIISYHIVSYHIISYHIILYICHTVSYHIMSYHVISHHIISYHII